MSDNGRLGPVECWSKNEIPMSIKLLLQFPPLELESNMVFHIMKSTSVHKQALVNYESSLKLFFLFSVFFHPFVYLFMGILLLFAGELKKKLAEPTGLHPQDQKLIFKDKERDSKAFLDVARVKDGSKIVLVEDVVSKERRCLEMLRNAKVEKASKSLAEINLAVDKLQGQV